MVYPVPMVAGGIRKKSLPCPSEKGSHNLMFNIESKARRGRKRGKKSR